MQVKHPMANRVRWPGAAGRRVGRAAERAWIDVAGNDWHGGMASRSHRRGVTAARRAQPRMRSASTAQTRHTLTLCSGGTTLFGDG